MELTGKRHEETFWREVNVINLIWGSDYINVFTARDDQTEHLKVNRLRTTKRTDFYIYPRVYPFDNLNLVLYIQILTIFKGYFSQYRILC